MQGDVLGVNNLYHQPGLSSISKDVVTRTDSQNI